MSIATSIPLATSSKNFEANTHEIHFRNFKQFDRAELLRLIPNAVELFSMPGDKDNHKYILPVSGGGDSSSLAIVLHILFPDYSFDLIFCDTKNEDKEIYSSLDALEEYLGKKITRLVPEHGLYELVEKFGGFLPSPNARWCTRILKLENFKPWLEQFAGSTKHMFVGVRFDEATRLAFAIDEVETSMPFIDMHVTREQVFKILDRTIGIPRYYQRRTRSGCASCFFQRRSELVGLLQAEPEEFWHAGQYEKLDPLDEDRYIDATPLWTDSGIACNWQTLPTPVSDAPIKGRKPNRASMPLFGDRGIFVAGEFFFDSFPGLEEFIWHQRVVSYSPTRAGLAGQIDDRYQHLLSTCEVYGLTVDELRRQARFSIWYIELPESIFDPDPPNGSGYTWQQGTSYKQLKHIVEWTTRALHHEGMLQASMIAARPLSVHEEWVESSCKGLTRINHEVGRVVTSEWYTPKETARELSIEEEARSLACPACSI